MKKISFYILITLICANVFVPFGLSITSSNNIEIQKQVVKADDYQIKLQAFKDSIEGAKQAASALAISFKNKESLDRISELGRAFEEAFSKADQAAKELRATATTEAQKKEVDQMIKDGLLAIQKAKENPVDINAIKATEAKNTYTLLAPIGNITEIKTNKGIGDYLGVIFKIAIGLCGALAVVMIVIGGIQYMGQESVFGKTEAKSRIWSAIFGLLIALGAWLILNTIDPALTGSKGLVVDQLNVSVLEVTDMPEGGDISETITDADAKSGKLPGIKCASGSATQGFCMFGTIDNPKPTGEIPALVTALKAGYKLTQVHIYPNDRIFFTAEKGSDKKQFATTGIGHGANGWSNGNGYSGDKKTPYGEFKITRTRKAPDQMTVIRSTRTDKSGVGYSMGGAVFNLDSRGIAIHSNRKNSQGTTAACILMYNDDLFALYPYISNGLKVVVGP